MMQIAQVEKADSQCSVSKCHPPARVRFVSANVLLFFFAALWVWPQVALDVGAGHDGVDKPTLLQVSPAEPRPERAARDASPKLPNVAVATSSTPRGCVVSVATSSARLRDQRASLRTKITRLRVPRMNDEPPGTRT